MFGYRKKNNRVGCEVILQRMREQEAERRSGEGGDQVRNNVWATALADLRAECEKGDPQRVATLETMLENARATVCEQKRWNETLHASLTKNGATIGKQEGEIKRLQEENDARGAEIKRLQEENRDLCQVVLTTITTIVVKDLQEKEVRVPLCCPISMQIFKDPVVSIFGHSFEREDIEKWLVEHHRCPMTRQYMTIAHLAPNYALAGVADAFRAHQAEQEKPAQ